MTLLNANHPSIPKLLEMFNIKDKNITGFTLDVDIDRLATLEIRKYTEVNEEVIVSKMYHLVPIDDAEE